MLTALLFAENIKIKDLSNRQQIRGEQSVSTGVDSHPFHHFPSPYPVLLNHGLQRVLTTHDLFLPPVQLLMLHVFFQARGISF